MLLPLWSVFEFVSLLVPTLYQRVCILDQVFKDRIIIPFKFKRRPFLCKCNAELLLWKMTFLSSCFKILFSFVNMLFASFISVQTKGDDVTMSLQFRWNLLMISLPFVKSFCVKCSVLYELLVPIRMMILSGPFSR